MNKFMFTVLLCGGAGALCANAAAQAATYDISNDFSVSNGNPNGVWTYGFSSTLGGTLTNYDVATTPIGLQDWTSSTVNSLGAPADFNNPTGSAITTCGSCTPLPAHTAAFHPGQNGEFSVYRFTSPVTGSFNLSAIFAAIDHGGTDVHILDNGLSIFSHAIDPNNTPISFNTLLALVAGDKIDFAVGFGADGDFFFDSTSINATFTTAAATATPLPAALPLFAAGLGVIGLLARRRKRKASAAA